MYKNFLWTGREYYSLENCIVKSVSDGFEVDSVIVGKYQGEIYRVQYTIHLNEAWFTTSVEALCIHKEIEKRYILEADTRGHWKLNGQPTSAFNGCLDIDIPVTPFTNSLPVNRMQLTPGNEAEISVIYIDLLNSSVRPLKQKYKRISDTVYHYENIPNDFEADITVDDNGFVIDYPGLFFRS